MRSTSYIPPFISLSVSVTGCVCIRVSVSVQSDTEKDDDDDDDEEEEAEEEGKESKDLLVPLLVRFIGRLRYIIIDRRIFGRM